MRQFFIYSRRPLIILSLISLFNCSDPGKQSAPDNAVPDVSPVIEAVDEQVNTFPLDEEDPRYLFDATKHTVEELINLLKRAEELVITKPDSYEKLDIVLILHGPDINLFRKKNYIQNRELVDLAAKLDAFRIIDMKICETAMAAMNVTADEVPPFIEPVPYAPAEIERLTDEGYIDL